jgi:serine/threonine-protein kinase
MKKIWLRILFVVLAILLFDKLLMPLYTSQGRQASVPDVKNMPYGKAARALGRAGLEAKRSYNVRYLGNVAADVVIDQIPAPGSKVKPGRKVYLVLNRKEKPSYSMPELYGRPEDEARQSLARLGMTVGDVQQRLISNPDEDGKVVSQSVPPNAMVKAGTTVSLIVGKLEEEPAGMKRVVVPEILGMSLDQARNTLAERGLSVGRIIYEYSAILVPNTVISQKPSVNTFVPSGQAIELTVVTPDQP